MVAPSSTIYNTSVYFFELKILHCLHFPCPHSLFQHLIPLYFLIEPFFLGRAGQARARLLLYFKCLVWIQTLSVSSFFFSKSPFSAFPSTAAPGRTLGRVGLGQAGHPLVTSCGVVWCAWCEWTASWFSRSALYMSIPYWAVVCRGAAGGWGVWERCGGGSYSPWMFCGTLLQLGKYTCARCVFVCLCAYVYLGISWEVQMHLLNITDNLHVWLMVTFLY